MLAIWGCCNTETKVKSLGYVKFFFDNLERYRQMKEENDKPDIEEKVDFIHIEDDKEGSSDLDELL